MPHKTTALLVSRSVEEKIRPLVDLSSLRVVDSMATLQENQKDWVPFENDASFEKGSSSRDGRGRSGASEKMRRRSRSRTSREHIHRDQASTSSTGWMERPVRGDASWVPIAAPDAAGLNSPSASRRTEASIGLQPVNPPNRSKVKDSTHHESLRPTSVHNIPKPKAIAYSSRPASTGGLKEKPEKRRARSRSRGRARSSSSTGTTGTAPITSITTVQKSDVPPLRSRSRSRGPSSNNSLSGKSTTSAGAATRRGRISNRPPPTRVPSERARSRSASLTRITSPRAPTVLNSPSAGLHPSTTVLNSPSAAMHSAPMMLNSPSAKSTKSSKSARRPPTTSRTRQEMRARRGSDSNSIGPGIKSRSSRSEDGESLKDSNIGREFSFGQELTASSSGSDTSNSNGKAAKASFREKLFGTQGDGSCRHGLRTSNSFEIRPRILLAATVYHNTATNLWITTINTNQRGVAKNPKLANKYLKAFSFQTETEARESAIANAPPKMVAFNDSPACFVCHSKFAVFKRASHCRNCGVSICSSCTKTWPARHLPETYNLKNESIVKVCSTCDTLSMGFRKALLVGEYEEAVAVYGTGNINLRTPFAIRNKKEEVIYPVHAAIEGGNIKLVRWLMEDHFCPVKMARVIKSKKTGEGDTLIPTSKGRTALSIAMENSRVNVLQYLIVERGVSVFESANLDHALRSLEAALVALPRAEDSAKHTPALNQPAPRWDDQAYFDDNVSEPSSLGEDDIGTVDCESRRSAKTKSSRNSNGGNTVSNKDRCIICMDRKINCVATPCGHQVCCLHCSANLSNCPICNSATDFIKIFRA